jgi:hypothetical protein
VWVNSSGLKLGLVGPMPWPLGDCLQRCKEHELQREGSCGVEDYIGKDAGTVGQKALMEFICTGDEERGGDGQDVAKKLPSKNGVEGEAQGLTNAVTQSEPESAEADQGKYSIAGEVAGLANDVVGIAPILID